MATVAMARTVNQTIITQQSPAHQCINGLQAIFMLKSQQICDRIAIQLRAVAIQQRSQTGLHASLIEKKEQPLLQTHKLAGVRQALPAQQHSLRKFLRLLHAAQAINIRFSILALWR